LCLSDGDQLDSDLALQSRVARPIDLTHSTGAESSQNFIGPHPYTGGKRKT
jgi:hypothetical protein